MTEGSGLLRRFYTEILEGGNLGLIDELATADYLDHEEALPGQPPGKEGVRYFVNEIRAAFPDIRAKTLEPFLTDGNMEACYYVLTGTHRGEMAGVAPTGKSVEFGGIDIIRVQDGKVAEHWGSTDNLRLMQQIGAIPE
jgi:predicted ester cyclase